jgi:diaminopimelate decarboxylase
MDARVCYAVKANGNLAVLRLLAAAGAGFDIVSGGELDRVLRAGGDPGKVVFAGVGKMREEIEFALEAGIAAFNCESEAEIALIDALAGRMGKQASVAIRVNPDVDPATHPYISTGLREHKFGIDIAAVEDVYERARGLANIRLEGVSCHIGSQLLDTSPLLEAARKLVELAGRLRGRGFPIRHLDLGGGIGVPYKPGDPRPDVGSFLASLRALLSRPRPDAVARAGPLHRGRIGRSADPRALPQEQRRQGVHRRRRVDDRTNPARIVWRVSRDCAAARLYRTRIRCRRRGRPRLRDRRFSGARPRQLPQLVPGDYAAVLTAGAYGWVASSNYNGRPRPAEVLVEGPAWRVVRRRETYEDLVRGEA